MENGAEALARLLEGNRRFLDGCTPPVAGREEIERLAVEGQRPYAVVVCCSDARVPPELVLCCGLGEIFVVRTAGNVVSPLEVGSVEFGVCVLGARLVLIIGHSCCGAVAGALAGGTPEGALAAVLAELTPSLEQARALACPPAGMAAMVENMNIQRSLEKIKASPPLQGIPGLCFAAAKYDTATGRVAVLSSDCPF